MLNEALILLTNREEDYLPADMNSGGVVRSVSLLVFGDTTFKVGEEAILIFYRPLSSEEGE